MAAVEPVAVTAAVTVVMVLALTRNHQPRSHGPQIKYCLWKKYALNMVLKI